VQPDAANPNLLGVVPIQVALNHFELSRPIDKLDQIPAGIEGFIRKNLGHVAKRPTTGSLPATVIGNQLRLRFLDAFEEVCGAIQDLAVDFNSTVRDPLCYIKRIDDLLFVVNILEKRGRSWSMAFFIQQNESDTNIYCSKEGENTDRKSWAESARLNDDGKTFWINKVGTKIVMRNKKYSRLTPKRLADYMWRALSLGYGIPYHKPYNSQIG
jgi:hypothetical protein